MIVISSAYSPPAEAKAKCLANLLGALVGVPDDEIVVSLDGDDWLLPGALARVQSAHDRGAR